MILGIDEVGRGPWAGPLVVGAVVLDDAHPIAGLDDSKKLSRKRREELDKQIRAQALGFGLGWVSAQELDEGGLSAALCLATRRAVERVKAPYHEIIIDGTINFLKDTSRGQFVTTLAKADALIPAVSAASIIAKVARDKFMAKQDTLYPGYGFSSHVGYGTAQHRQAIEKLGVTPLHRLSFAPLKAHRQDSTKAVGDRAEVLVAEQLVERGHQIIGRNVRSRWSEIDIISTKGTTMYFTEVKYRRQAGQGGGIEAITADKLRRMKQAAEAYMAITSHFAPRLMVAVVEGDDFALKALLALE